ncbi:hypothetical protein [Halorubellus sp. PRR65]|uniref:hypothetical protein n=1 Tax=Halorubellus sp. PRR65 TaxID=3098148 RepID=UPI002B25F390|nr:hypothetical protein [Halorubellus sp. PRR65]
MFWVRLVFVADRGVGGGETVPRRTRWGWGVDFGGAPLRAVVLCALLRAFVEVVVEADGVEGGREDVDFGFRKAAVSVFAREEGGFVGL